MYLAIVLHEGIASCRKASSVRGNNFFQSTLLYFWKLLFPWTHFRVRLPEYDIVVVSRFSSRGVDSRLECDAISFPDTFLCLKTHCTVALNFLTLYPNFLWDVLFLKWLMIFRTTGLIIQDCFTTIKQINVAFTGNNRFTRA